MRAVTDCVLLTLGFDDFLMLEHRYLNAVQQQSIAFLASLPLFQVPSAPIKE
jgi:hypothetical protein